MIKKELRRRVNVLVYHYTFMKTKFSTRAREERRTIAKHEAWSVMNELFAQSAVRTQAAISKY